MSLSTPSLRAQYKAHHPPDPFLLALPKLELHLHIEGTLTPSLRWSLSQRNNVPLTTGSSKVPLSSLAETQDAYTHIRGRIGAASAEARDNMTFHEAYYGGFELLRTERDFYELAMGYFDRAKEMGVLYCEVFFDAQGHMRRGVSLSVVMAGFGRAQSEARERLNVKSQWIMCILRDMSPSSALQAYEAALPYRHLIAGIGLDGDELNNPPSLFQEVFRRARADGWRVTAHCDFNQKNTHENIRYVVTELGGGGGTGAERIDHGMNAADEGGLMEGIREKGVGMTVCPCAYVRHTAEEEVFPRIRRLFDEGIKVTVGSDDPAYMEDNWLVDNLIMVRDKCQFTDREMAQLQRHAVDICWASEEVKEGLRGEIDAFEKAYLSQ